MSNNQGLMQNKKGIILGVANEYSIAWYIALILKEQGADVILTYPNEQMQKRVDPLSAKLDPKMPTFSCDVSKTEDVKKLYEDIQNFGWDKIDFIVHAVAFSDKNELRGRYIQTSQENFMNAMNISCYSLTAVAQVFEPMMVKNCGGSIITLTYYGGEKVVPHYNVMGLCKAALDMSVKYLAVDMGPKNIRVNAVSAGPLKTLSSAGIGDFKYIGDWNKNNAPLRRNVTHHEAAKAALYLLSDLSSGVTGEIHHVDCGYNVIGMKAVDAPDVVILKKESGVS